MNLNAHTVGTDEIEPTEHSDAAGAEEMQLNPIINEVPSG